MTNKEFANKNSNFIKHCTLANVKPTTRQASKFRKGKGAVYKMNVLHLSVHIPDHAKLDKLK